MKTCCICLRPADGDEPTCVACGEASWSVVAVIEPPPVVEGEAEIEPDPPTPVVTVEGDDAPVKKRRSR